MQTIFMDQDCLKNFLKTVFKWVKCYLNLMSASWKIMMNEGYFLEVDVEYTKELFNLHSNLPFSPERKKKLKM